MSLALNRQTQIHPQWYKITAKQAVAFSSVVTAITDSFTPDMDKLDALFPAPDKAQPFIQRVKDTQEKIKQLVATKVGSQPIAPLRQDMYEEIPNDGVANNTNNENEENTSENGPDSNPPPIPQAPRNTTNDSAPSSNPTATHPVQKDLTTHDLLQFLTSKIDQQSHIS